jgi:acid phosphatase (class A)
MRKLVLWSILLLSLGATPALSLSDKPYLAATDASFADLIPPPPADGPPRDKFDLQTVLVLQKSLNPKLMAQIQADTVLSVYQLAGEVFGPSFTKERFPMAGAFFDKVNTDSGVGVREIKQKYKRQRPFQASKQVQTPPSIAQASQGPTYPSGHGTFGAEAAILLAMMVPEKRTELFARGWQYGTQRMLSGVAYPSDLEAARIGASLMVALMLQKPEFRADFDAVKAEVRKGLGLAP